MIDSSTVRWGALLVALAATGSAAGAAASGSAGATAEAALTAFLRGDVPALAELLAPATREAIAPERLTAQVAAVTEALGTVRSVLLDRVEAGEDGCQHRVWAVALERASAAVDLRVCPVEDGWEVTSLRLVPDPRGLAEVLIRDSVPEKTGASLLDVVCAEGEPAPRVGGAMDCIAVTEGGETLELEVARPGESEVEIVEAEVTAEGPPEPSREVLEPTVRALVGHLSEGNADALWAMASPGLRRDVGRDEIAELVELVRTSFGSLEEARWTALERDAEDGLPVVRMELAFSRGVGRLRVKLFPVHGRWAPHLVVVKAVPGSAAEKTYLAALLQRLARRLTLDPEATLTCPSGALAERGAEARCRLASDGRSLEVTARRDEDPEALQEISLSAADLELAVIDMFRSMERPLGRELLALECPERTLEQGTSVRCSGRFDDGSRQLEIRRTEGGYRLVDVVRVAG